MSSSFWKNNSCSPTWSSFLSNWLYSYPPKLIDSSIHSSPIPITPIRNCILRKALPSDLSSLSEFLHRFFSNSMNYSCSVPISLLQNPNWEIYVVLYNNQIIGSIVRKWISNLHVFQVKWPNAAIVDYFCVHPSWKKKGIGRWLLYTLHNSTLHSNKGPIPPHLILWEGIQPLYPPISIGMFLSKICLASSPILKSIPLTKEIWNLASNSKSIWNEFVPNGKEISVWKPLASNDFVIVWDSFHSSAYGPIGIVLSGSFEAIQQLSNSKSYWGVLLVPKSNLDFLKNTHNSWSFDSPYHWIAYNMVCSSFSDFPMICL